MLASEIVSSQRRQHLLATASQRATHLHRLAQVDVYQMQPHAQAEVQVRDALVDSALPPSLETGQMQRQVIGRLVKPACVVLEVRGAPMFANFAGQRPQPREISHQLRVETSPILDDVMNSVEHAIVLVKSEAFSCPRALVDDFLGLATDSEVEAPLLPWYRVHQIDRRDVRHLGSDEDAMVDAQLARHVNQTRGLGDRDMERHVQVSARMWVLVRPHGQTLSQFHRAHVRRDEGGVVLELAEKVVVAEVDGHLLEHLMADGPRESATDTNPRLVKVAASLTSARVHGPLDLPQLFQGVLAGPFSRDRALLLVFLEQVEIRCAIAVLDDDVVRMPTSKVITEK